MDSVYEDPMLPNRNEIFRRHRTSAQKSQVEARALIYVTETNNAGGVVTTLGTEADRNLKMKAAVDRQLGTFKTCALQVPTR
jgi:hypothetical protein